MYVNVFGNGIVQPLKYRPLLFINKTMMGLAMKKPAQLVTWGVDSVSGLILNHGLSSSKNVRLKSVTMQVLHCVYKGVHLMEVGG